jgi:flagellar motility protein MotE (MotC chaperone)
MIRLGYQFRLVPLVVVATTSLFALKTIEILVNGGFTLGGPPPAHAQELVDQVPRPESAGMDAAAAAAGNSGVAPDGWLQERLGTPVFTGQIGGKGPPNPAAGPAAGEPAAGGGNPPPPTDRAKAQPGAAPPRGDEHGMSELDRMPRSAGERVVLESLNKRREELDARARDLEMRENLLGVAQKRIEARLGELKALEARIDAEMHKRDEAEAGQLRTLVVMYENMKAKDAARIFDRLDLKILIDVVAQMNPRKMSDILAQMSPETAERLTTELARRAGVSGPTAAPPINELPKIEGHPSGT